MKPINTASHFKITDVIFHMKKPPRKHRGGFNGEKPYFLFLAAFLLLVVFLAAFFTVFLAAFFTVLFFAVFFTAFLATFLFFTAILAFVSALLFGALPK
jgi:hypothetical protein